MIIREAIERLEDELGGISWLQKLTTMSKA
jgi:hypothetical protein